jgi:signal transduction histidine kinase/ActR/RegA family two-component response regulator
VSIVLSGRLVGSRAYGRWRDLSLRRKTLAVFALPLLSVLVLGATLLVVGQHGAAADRLNQRAGAAQVASGELLVELLNAETGIRGYLVSGNRDFLAPYDVAVAEVPQAIRALQRLASGPTARVASLSTREMDLLGQLRASPPGVGRTSLLNAGKSTMDVLRGELDRISAADAAIVDANRQLGVRDHTVSVVTLLITIPISIAALLVAIQLFNVGLIRRIHALEFKAANVAAAVALDAPDGGADEIGRLDTEIHTTASVLAQREQERQAALAAAQEAAVRAEEASAAKTEFLSRVSHELRTPLNAVLGFGQLLQFDLTEPADLQAVEQILKGGEHLLELINEILDISAAESRELRFSAVAVDGARVIADSVALVAPLAKANSVVITTEVDGAVPCVRADPHRLRQVLLNLLSNAVKYNRPHGAVTVRLTEPGPGRCRITVTDTGRGISEQNMSRLFSPFDRLGAESLLIEGTGLGLMLTKSLTEAMHGDVGAESTQGVGSTFWVEFASTHELPDDVRVDPSAVVANERGDALILYIEDNLSNVLLIERLLADRGGTTLLAAPQGQLGLDLAVQHQPQLILLDLQLPDIEGAEVLLRLKSDPRTRQIPVAILTADARPEERLRLLHAGAYAYLAKPLRLPAALQIINEALADNPVALDQSR